MAPAVLDRLYRAGRTAEVELREWLRSKELQRAVISSEVRMLALVLGRLIAEGAHVQLIKGPAAERTCLRLCAIWKAYEKVKCAHDWQRPTGHPSVSPWGSKVDWGLAEEHFRVDGDWERTDLKTDAEASEKWKTGATFAKHLQNANECSAAGEELE